MKPSLLLPLTWLSRAGALFVVLAFTWTSVQAQDQINDIKPATTDRALVQATIVTIGSEAYAPSYRAGDIVVFNNINFTVPVDITGGSVQWDTGDTCECDTPPFNFNIWASSGNASFFWPGGAGFGGGGVATGGLYDVLSPGDDVGPGATFITDLGAAAAANWRQASGVDGYLGFRFTNPSTSETNYGFVRITTTGSTGHPATIVGWAYNQAGDPITVADLGAGDDPSISVDPSEFDFQAMAGTTDTAELSISNNGGATLNWEIAADESSCDSPAGVSWLMVDSENGATEPGGTDVVDVTADANDLDSGNYSALLCITSNDPGTPLVEVPVTLEVMPVSGEPGATPITFALDQNHPNPFTGSTTIGYALPEAALVTIEVFDLVGRQVATLVAGEMMEAGYHNATWDANGVATGIYLYRIQAGSYIHTLRASVVH